MADQLGFVAYQFALMAVKDAGAKVVVKKNSKFWRGWEKFVRVLTRQKAVNSYTSTTFGKTIYVCDIFDDLSDRSKADTLIHELVHVAQMSKMSVPVFLLVYLAPFLPFGLAYGRYWLERTAYLKGYELSLFGMPERDLLPEIWLKADEFAGLMAGASYGWAWPFKKSARRWMVKQLCKATGISVPNNL